MLAQSSASSFIYRSSTQLRGAGGIHLYVMVADGSDIERAGKALYEHLWRLGTGYFAVSRSGQLLDRNLIDRSVWQPERLDFAAGAVCIAPLEQRRPPATVWNTDASLFDTRLILEPTTEEKDAIKQTRGEARGAVEFERAKKRDVYVTELQKSIEARKVDPTIAAQTATAAADQSVLLGDFELTSEDGQRITVAEVLAKRSEYHGKRFADPLEPDYRGDTRIAFANLFNGGRPFIFSHAISHR
jgi:hypothetical protein